MRRDPSLADVCAALWEMRLCVGLHLEFWDPMFLSNNTSRLFEGDAAAPFLAISESSQRVLRFSPDGLSSHCLRFRVTAWV